MSVAERRPLTVDSLETDDGERFEDELDDAFHDVGRRIHEYRTAHEGKNPSKPFIVTAKVEIQPGLAVVNHVTFSVAVKEPDCPEKHVQIFRDVEGVLREDHPPIRQSKLPLDQPTTVAELEGENDG